MMHVGRLELVILVPGKDERETLDGLLGTRRRSLRIPAIRYEFVVAAQRDPGCYRQAHALLATFRVRAEHALVMFDHYGSGQERRSPQDVETEVEQRLAASGWGDRAAAIVLRPELENWIWSTSPHVENVLGWGGREPPLREWLQNTGLWQRNQPKPLEPKRCFKAALREVRLPQSSQLFHRLAERVSLSRCGDEAFHKLQRVLREWFQDHEQ